MSPFRIKCCGITRVEDALTAVELGFDAIGLVFARRSKRLLDMHQARAIRAALPAGIVAVCLFMDNAAAEVRDVIDAVQPDIAQFHGQESDIWCGQFDCRYIKAVAMGEGRAALPELGRYPGAEALLLDGNARGEVGGRGERFDWSLVADNIGQPWILAGGLDPDNVTEAIRLTRPWGVDVSSGVESSPGRKDAARMRSFVAAVRSVAADYLTSTP